PHSYSLSLHDALPISFNYAFASRMANPRSNGTQLDGFVAGDDEAAKQKTLEFAGSIGFRPIDAGPLSMARALEGMGLLHVLLQIDRKSTRLNSSHRTI